MIKNWDMRIIEFNCGIKIFKKKHTNLKKINLFSVFHSFNCANIEKKLQFWNTRHCIVKYDNCETYRSIFFFYT